MAAARWKVVLTVVCLGLAAGAGAADFQQGDLYLLSRHLPDTTPYEGIIKIDPGSGAVTRLFTASRPLTATLTYDPYRQLLVFVMADSGLVGVDAGGALTVLVPNYELDGMSLVAARGDGVLYLWNGSNLEFAYVNTTNTVYDLLDLTGTQPFSFPGGTLIEDMIYDHDTNSLICLTGIGNFPECPTFGETCAAKIPLDAAGTQVSGPVTSVSADIVSGYVENVVGSAHYKNPGEILIFLGKNTGPGYDVIQHLDIASMAFSSFATPSYPGDNMIRGGSYSTVLDKAVINDTYLDVIRTYALGETGTGDTLAVGNSGPGYSEAARMLEIPEPGPTAVAATFSPSSGLKLHIPHPNPFNPAVAIRFELESSGQVSLKIYDAAGRLTRSVLNGHRDAGEHRIHWDGRGNNGREAASGVYFVRLQSGTETATGRMVLIR